MGLLHIIKHVQQLFLQKNYSQALNRLGVRVKFKYVNKLKYKDYTMLGSTIISVLHRQTKKFPIN